MERPIPDLLAVRDSIYKHRRFILAVTLVAMMGGIIVYSFTPRKCVAETEFIVRNPMYGDRTVIYNSDSKLYDYFASEDDIDKLLMLSRTDLVQKVVIANMGLAAAYKLDTANEEDREALQRKFNKRLFIMRTEYRTIILSYADTDPRRAVAVANNAVQVLSDTYGDYFREMRMNMYESVLDKIHEHDSAINALTDSLVTIRDRYGIYASRYNYMLGSMSEKNSKKYGQGIEQIQNTETIKDALISDRAGQITLIDHYRTGLKKDQLPIVKVVTAAKIRERHYILQGVLTAVVCGALGFLFITLVLLVSDSSLFRNKRII